MGEQRIDLSDGRFVRPQGRTGREGETLRLFWACSGARMRLRCAALYAEVEAEYEEHAPWLAVLLDGACVTRFPLERGRRRVALLLGMDDSVTHDVSVVRDTQPIDTEPGLRVVLHALYVEGEALPCPPSETTVEFVGDSLTTGEGTLGPVGAMEWRGVFLSASHTYAQMLCDRLHAEGRWVSMSGWGVYSAWDGERAHALPRVYDALCALERGGDVPNDFSAQPADLIVVNLGTNDSNVVANAPEAERPALRRAIEDAAFDFLRQLRARQSGAYLLWVYGMCGHPLGATLRRAVARAQAAGDARVGYLSLPACRKGEEGSRAHPGYICHRRAAEAIAARWQEICRAEANKDK